MEKLLQWMEYIEDVGQERKVRHKLKDILAIVLFTTLAGADDWVEIAEFAEVYENYLKKYTGLENCVPSHDTIQRVMGMVSPEALQQLYIKWQGLLDSGEGEALKKIVCIDGKTMRGNKNKGEKPLHIVSAWSKEDGFCMGQRAVMEKSNEITAIPLLLETIQIKGNITTTDAMGTQTAIAEKIKSRRADYVLAVKGNQKTLYNDIKDYFSEKEFLIKIKEKGCYKKSIEKSHGQLETREYYQTGDIKWLCQRKGWKGMKSIIMEHKVLEKEGEKHTEYRYFISSLPEDINLASRAVRGHWSVESMHWHLDVTFREDYNTTADKTAAQNHNIIRKWCLSILKLAELSLSIKRLSLKKKRFAIGLRPVKFLEEVLSI